MNFDDLPLIRFKPTPSDAELAAERDIKRRDQLAALVKRNKLDGRKIGQRFSDDYGQSIYEADADTIEAFTAVIAEEAA